MTYEFDEIESCECIGMFEDEYVYDIEVDDETHTFIANSILIHNSLYLCFNNLLNTIKGWKDMPLPRQTEIVVKLNRDFLDKHNCEFMKNYYASRHAQSIHEFELETIAWRDVRLNVKKRYAQLLVWKDGKDFSGEDHLKIKAKGLEMIKSSIPREARAELTELIRFLLEKGEDEYILQELNIKMQEMKERYYKAPIDDISAYGGVQGYNKYILDDRDPSGLKVGEKCPANVRALGNYNWLRNVHGLPGEPIYGGKVKMYKFHSRSNIKGVETFAYQGSNYPDWADKWAPVARDLMFQQYVIDPFNRIIESAGIGKLNIDGSISMGLFDGLM